MYALPFGISGSLVYKISAACGEKKVQKAKNFYYFSILCAIFTGLIEVIFTVIFLDQVTVFYTNDDQIKDYIKMILKLFLWFYVIDHMQVSTSGIAKGMDLSNKGNFIPYLLKKNKLR
jgi:Na+-driven multidrug efflux pump